MKKIIISIISTFVATVLLVVVFLSIWVNHQTAKAEKLGIFNVEKVDFELPNFSLYVQGLYNDSITDEDMKELQMYEFEAVTTDGYENHYHTYIGVPLQDVLYFYGIDAFNYIDLQGNGERTVRYQGDEVNEDMYMVFSMDGENFFDNEPVNIINIGLLERYGMENLTGIVVG